jgi:sigma-E factor negative regulatory protein RseA
MTNPSESSAVGLPAQLSALADGELTAEQAGPVVVHWREDSQARADWHAFHLIGDVLRSEDLASGASHDAAFLNSLRARLAEEPVVLAPGKGAEAAAPGALAVRRHRPWVWSSAAAMTLLVVGTAAWTTRDNGQVAASLAQAPSALPASAAQAEEQQQVLVVRGDQGRVLRDAQIERYLAAHQQFVGTSALGAPSGFIRNAAVDVPRR